MTEPESQQPSEEAKPSDYFEQVKKLAKSNKAIVCLFVIFLIVGLLAKFSSDIREIVKVFGLGKVEEQPAATMTIQHSYQMGQDSMYTFNFSFQGDLSLLPATVIEVALKKPTVFTQQDTFSCNQDLREIAQKFIEEENFSAAAELYGRIVDLCNDPISRLNAGAAFFMIEKYEVARKYLQCTNDSTEYDAELFCTLSGVMLALDQRDSAYFFLNKSIGIKPLTAAFYNRGVLKVLDGDTSGALADLGRAVDIDPNDTTLIMEAGSLALASGHVQQAKNFYLLAVQLAPSNPVAIYNLGVAELCLGDSRRARELFAQTLMIDPKRCQAATTLAKSYFIDKNWVETAKRFDSIPLDCLGDTDIRLFVRSLLFSHDISAAQRKLDELRGRISNPTLVLELQTHIFLDQQRYDSILALTGTDSDVAPLFVREAYLQSICRTQSFEVAIVAIKLEFNQHPDENIWLYRIAKLYELNYAETQSSAVKDSFALYMSAYLVTDSVNQIAKLDPTNLEVYRGWRKSVVEGHKIPRVEFQPERQ